MTSSAYTYLDSFCGGVSGVGWGGGGGRGRNFKHNLSGFFQVVRYSSAKNNAGNGGGGGGGTEDNIDNRGERGRE